MIGQYVPLLAPRGFRAGGSGYKAEKRGFTMRRIPATRCPLTAQQGGKARLIPAFPNAHPGPLRAPRDCFVMGLLAMTARVIASAGALATHAATVCSRLRWRGPAAQGILRGRLRRIEHKENSYGTTTRHRSAGLFARLAQRRDGLALELPRTSHDRLVSAFRLHRRMKESSPGVPCEPR